MRHFTFCVALFSASLTLSCGCGRKIHPNPQSSSNGEKSLHEITGYSLAAFAGSTSPTYRDQGWNDQQRQKFYTTSQGSQMMPLSWFMALEQPSTTDLFLSDGLLRFGYLPNSRGPLNPCGLPVGFTIDPAPTSPAAKECPVAAGVDDTQSYWVGMTCAACHTGRVTYKGATLQIDGAPTNADLYKFLAEVDTAVAATLSDGNKFSRFAVKVVGSDERKQHDLRNELTRFSAYFHTLVDASTPPTPWGPARTDAFGMIFNRVTAIDLSDRADWQPFHPLESNNSSPNAPVSYPFLWGTSRQDYVQWNGVALNTFKDARLIRNVGEGLGVFGRVNIQRSTRGTVNYASTVNLGNQREIEENLVSALRSPQWPADVFGPLDPSKVSQGRPLYRKYCESCHGVVERVSNRPVKVCVSPIDAIGTDPTMATNLACRKVDTGVLEGARLPFGKKLEHNDFVISVVGNVGFGVLSSGILAGQVNLGGLDPFRDTFGRIATCSTSMAHERPLTRQAASSRSSCMDEEKVYRARPLDGIWATGPFLHNGSIPSLAQLLLPAKSRIAKFYVGSREFIPGEVGFEYTKGPFEFDTSKPGNSNGGHEYGSAMSKEDREALLEYLKSL
jgi:hypothetical protein